MTADDSGDAGRPDVGGSAGTAGSAGSGRPPRELMRPYLFSVAGAGLIAVAMLLLIVERGAILDAAVTARPDLSRDALSRLITEQIVVNVVIAVPLGAAAMYLAYRARAGVRWARLVLTVVGVLLAAFAVLSGGLIPLAGGLVVLVGLVLFYLPAAGAHFRPSPR